MAQLLACSQEAARLGLRRADFARLLLPRLLLLLLLLADVSRCVARNIGFFFH